MYKGLRTGTRTSRTIAEDKGTNLAGFGEEMSFNHQAGVPTSTPGANAEYHDESEGAVVQPLSASPVTTTLTVKHRGRASK